MTFHDAFPYFARHFGFELVGVILANVGQEPTAAELAALVDKVKAAGVKAVFSEAQFSPKLAQTLADEAGVTQVVTTLYNDALGPRTGRHVPRHDALEHGADRGGARNSRTDRPPTIQPSSAGGRGRRHRRRR